MTAEMRVGKQDYTVTGRAGTFKVSLSWYGSQSAKRWEVILWRGRRVTWFGLFPRWRWRRIRTETRGTPYSIALIGSMTPSAISGMRCRSHDLSI